MDDKPTLMIDSESTVEYMTPERDLFEEYALSPGDDPACYVAYMQTLQLALKCQHERLMKSGPLCEVKIKSDSVLAEGQRERLVAQSQELQWWKDQLRALADEAFCALDIPTNDPATGGDWKSSADAARYAGHGVLAATLEEWM